MGVVRRRRITHYEYALLPYGCGDRAWLRATAHQVRPRRSIDTLGSRAIPLHWQVVGGKFFHRMRESVLVKKRVH